ncbi:MAG: Protein of unknown function YycH [Clostridia bacterium]|jgi:regulatory protein YycI of two-component signal transduction system YycFG|nr:Protein of unknown function YycH [Clostridia bacterium]
MDWKRAKAILIIMFLVVNTFLFYQLVSANRSQYRYTTKEELATISTYLKSKNIKLGTEIPVSVPVIPSLTVKFKTFEMEQLAKSFFQGKEYTSTKLNEGYALDSGDITIEVKNDIYFTYKNKAITIKPGEANKEKILKQIDSFIKDLKLNTDNKYIILEEQKNGYLRLIWGQQYKGLAVESSQIEILATEEGVAEARIHWFETIKADKKHGITTPIIALLEAYRGREDGASPLTIKQIRQGYYFNVELKRDEQGNIPLEGTVLPMWIIESDKSQIYINAYSEKFERVKQ